MGVRSSQPRSPNLNKTDGHLIEYFRQNFGGGGGGSTTTSTCFFTAVEVVNEYKVSSTVYRSHVLTHQVLDVSIPAFIQEM